jgi:hypothetical protein
MDHQYRMGRCIKVYKNLFLYIFGIFCKNDIILYIKWKFIQMKYKETFKGIKV